jgi:hypothetical protein
MNRITTFQKLCRRIMSRKPFFSALFRDIGLNFKINFQIRYSFFGNQIDHSKDSGDFRKNSKRCDRTWLFADFLTYVPNSQPDRYLQFPAYVYKRITRDSWFVLWKSRVFYRIHTELGPDAKSVQIELHFSPRSVLWNWRLFNLFLLLCEKTIYLFLPLFFCLFCNFKIEVSIECSNRANK